MKLHAHMPTITTGSRDWRLPMIALGSLLATSILVLGYRSGLLLNNPLVGLLRQTSITRAGLGVNHRVSLEIHLSGHAISPASRFSVAHPLPVNVASSQLFSIGLDSRVAFEVFGETAQSELLVGERTVPQLELRSDRLMLMLMLLRLPQHRD
jgi:hypothetical protein